MNRPPVSGFTLVRNGIRFDYPFRESIRSLLPFVDELVVNVGVSDDGTLEAVQELAREAGGKLVVFESVWPLDDPEKKREGRILSEQSNLALDRCRHDWCFYLQADEVLHDADGERIRQALAFAERERARVEALVFEYVHFYGSYDVIQHSRSAYRREVRVIRRSSGARSVGDAQSFRAGGEGGRKLEAWRAGGARVMHYGWVKPPEAMREKTFFMDQLYHGDPTEEQKRTGLPTTGENYRYKRFWGLRPFDGEHPAVMASRIREKSWHWDFKGSPFSFSRGDFKKVTLDLLERVTGHRFFEYRGYRLRGIAE